MFFLYKNWRPHTVFVWQDFSHWEMCRIMIQIYIKKVHTEPLRRGQQPQCCPLSSDTVSCQGMDAHNGRTTEPRHCTRKAFHRALRRFSEHLSLITISYFFLLSSYSKSTKKKKLIRVECCSVRGMLCHQSAKCEDAPVNFCMWNCKCSDQTFRACGISRLGVRTWFNMSWQPCLAPVNMHFSRWRPAVTVMTKGAPRKPQGGC